MSSDKSGPPPGFATGESSSAHTMAPPPPSAPMETMDLVRSNESSSSTSQQPQQHNPQPQSAPYPEPPPSYQNAMSYPAAAPYGQPAMNASYPPKPMANAGYPPQPAPTYYPQPQPNVVVNALPQPNPQPRQAVIVHVGGASCRHCHMGVMQKETDMCCMICLILLTIFTFPFGLVFLCCLPCAVTIRCSNCHRI